ncbi:MAG: hypothetical protein COV85_03840 [Candidatus Portnoybacteria bacterium CG11_big_fil_rev_8_21_14_0_20_44_10]|uniref:Uncharacterized protein n=1 Tax=Candidatus Portnoybacteria bacterium CG11_big_fil_rev_8_21_14_0_20_44_10 TaxID=1974818 RepID=A0A2H0KPM0_9BACT|nr:MAG: hypothetical protein COV85_03840 [Candidatus Portnoybacteria bacterium CG11_big_fil_rev_8_21_14_0_20_44_10]
MAPGACVWYNLNERNKHYLDNLQKYNLIRLFMYPSAGFFFLSLTKKKGGKILRNFKTCH